MTSAATALLSLVLGSTIGCSGSIAAVPSVAATLERSAQLPMPAPAAQEPQVEHVATSVQGREIYAYRIGSGSSSVRLVLIGQMHGNEPAGAEIVDELFSTSHAQESADRRGTDSRGNGSNGIDIWLIPTLNPDGRTARSRVNSHGVDLNRNFPTSWRRAGKGTSQWSGSAPASEPEVQGLISFLRQINPTAVVVLHQDYAVVDLSHPRSRVAGRRLADLLGLPARPVGCSGKCHGTLTEWVDQDLAAIALTVELPGRVSGRQVRRYANALLDFATWLARPPAH
jgi:protein MpaA